MHNNLNYFCEICGTVNDLEKECYYTKKWWHKILAFLKRR